MTPAERLLAAADLLDKRAGEATPGPWRHNPNKHWRKPGTAWFEEAVFAGPAGKDAECVAGTGETDDPQSMADARYIALMHPEVGKALAKVLRAEVERLKRTEPVRAFGGAPLFKPQPDILALADLLLAGGS